jgi:hypothetical protein
VKLKERRIDEIVVAVAQTAVPLSAGIALPVIIVIAWRALENRIGIQISERLRRLSCKSLRIGLGDPAAA